MSTEFTKVKLSKHKTVYVEYTETVKRDDETASFISQVKKNTQPSRSGSGRYFITNNFFIKPQTKMSNLLKSILVTTEHRGVFYAEVSPEMDLTKTTLTDLKNCRMAVRFGTTKGVMQLCQTGPTPSSKISSPADIDVLHKVTGVFAITPEAASAWKECK